MSSINYSLPKTIAIGLGGNIESKAGSPKSTLIASRPLIENAIDEWFKFFLKKNSISSSINFNIDFRWSPLYKTQPIGGPKGQPDFINAVLVIHGDSLEKLNPSIEAAKNLLKRFCSIEKEFGRDRLLSKSKWGPRSLDIDLLAWGDLHIHTPDLILPHPRLIERDFVIIPLAKALKVDSIPPVQIPPQEGWWEQ